MYHFCITLPLYLVAALSFNSFIFYGEPGADRTHDPRLKRALLYQLSYGLTNSNNLPSFSLPQHQPAGEAVPESMPAEHSILA